MNQISITLVASKAIDTLIDEDGKVINVQKGGPAYFIERVFREQGISYDILSSGEIQVEILISQNGEKGRIVSLPKPLAVPFGEINTKTVVISTIAQEISIEKLSDYKGKVFLDIQGFVRDGRNFGAKKPWIPSEKLLSCISCIKATIEELKYLDSAVVDRQKEKMLLITNGAFGTTMFIKGKEYNVIPEKIASPQHTLGAGDTLFAYFIVFYLGGNDPLTSLKNATLYTSNFLAKI